MAKLRTVEVISVGLNAALYASFGYLTYLGIFAPAVGVVRFWPSVIIPAIFAILFGPWVGGVGAAIGVFISDIAIHGNALLSLTVGIPSNFTCFYLVGFLGRSKLGMRWVLLGASLTGVLTLLAVWLYWIGVFDRTVLMIYASVGLFSLVLALLTSYLWPQWRNFEIGSIVGLTVGSGIIGIGVWLFSQLFTLPSGDFRLPLYASALWFAWTYFTEIPFLIAFVPPVLRVCYSAFPWLKLERKQ